MSSVIRGADNFDSKRFTSAEQTITSSGLLTVPHGLGVEPSQIEITLICKVADAGWSIGDVLRNKSLNQTDPATNRLHALYSDTTNIYLRMSSQTVCFNGANKTTGATANLLNVNWKIILRAKA